VPEEAYVTPAWFCVVEVAGTPVPKFQLYVSPAPTVPVLVKSTPEPVHCGAVDVNETEGVWLIVITFDAVAEQPVSVLVTVSVTVIEPAVENVTPLGFCADDVEGFAPAPKLQLYTTLAPLEPVLVKFTFAPVHLGAVDVNDAVGVWSIIMFCVAVAEQPDAVVLVVSVTVFVPEEA